MSKPIFKVKKYKGDERAFEKMRTKSYDVPNAKRGMSFYGSVMSSIYSENLTTVFITDIEPFNENVKRYRLERADGAALPYFDAGQNVGVFVKTGKGKFLKPFAICSSPSDKYYSITVFREDVICERILDDWLIGTEIEITVPNGHFTYRPIRDEYNVLAFAAQSGISPFISMAQSIVEGKEDFSLNVIYSVTQYPQLFKNYFDWLESNSEGKVKFHYVSGKDDKKTSTIIRGLSRAPFSVFACGPSEYMSWFENHLIEFGIDKKHFHKRVPFLYSDASADKSHPYVRHLPKILTVTTVGAVYPPIPVERGDTLMAAMEKAGLNVPVKCMTGECGFCRSRLIEGALELINDEKREVIDVKYSYVHPCLCYPLTNVILEVPIKRDKL